MRGSELNDDIGPTNIKQDNSNNNRWDLGTEDGGIENGKGLLRKMIVFAYADDEGDLRQGWVEEGGVEEAEDDEEDDEEDVHPRGRRRNPFIADECEVAKSGREEDVD